jgi:hypothetical protein
MVMIRPTGKPHKIAKAVLANKGVKVASGERMDKTKMPKTAFVH